MPILGHQAETLIHEVIAAPAFGAWGGQLARITHYLLALSEILPELPEELAD